MLRRAGRRGALARRRAWLCRRAERENLKRRRLPTPSGRLAVSLGGRFDPGHRHRPAEVAALAMLTIPCSSRQPSFRRPRGGRPPDTTACQGLHFGVVRAAGVEPAQAFRPYGFSYPLRLSPPPFGVWGLDYPFTLARARLRCCPSSLYTFRRACGCRRLGSGLPLGEVSPTLGSSTAPVSRGALNCSSPLRLPISPRPHLAANLTTTQDRAKPKSAMRRRR
jgi:hypothetical protein